MNAMPLMLVEESMFEIVKLSCRIMIEASFDSCLGLNSTAARLFLIFSSLNNELEPLKNKLEPLNKELEPLNKEIEELVSHCVS